MTTGRPSRRDLQQAATLLRYEATELAKLATADLERAAEAGAQDVVGEYVRHAARLEQEARRLERVARWLEALGAAPGAPRRGG